MFKKILASAFSFTLCLSLSAQTWVDLMHDENANFYQVQDAFNKYWEGKTITKGKGWKQYKRWEWFTKQRVYPSGERIAPDRAFREFETWKQSLPPQQRSASGAWTSMGPVNPPTSGGGSGRVSCVRFDPSNASIMYAGTPGGGLWKSTNSGTSWTNLNTDNLQSLGVTDVAIDPTNSNILYIGTGDGDGADTYSIGVLKSTDGGATWSQTGLNWQTSQARTISKLLIHPANPQIIIAATSSGIWRSTDGGTNWVQTLIGGFKDAEFKPGDPNTVYVAGNNFRKSNDGGITWSTISLTVSQINRIAIAVTPADANYVYLLCSNSSDNGFKSLMRSTDSGVSFTEMSNASTEDNILGWDSDGEDAGGQGWYDLAIAASPTNKNEIFTGGVNIYRSTDGGTNFTLNAHWYGGGGKPYVHADIHDLIFLPGSGTTLWVGCDGGIFRTTNNGGAYTQLSNGLVIGQMYRLGVAQTQPGKAITGWQDNGTNYRDNAGVWDRVLGGDGMECMFSHVTSGTMYGEYYYGSIEKSTDYGANWNTIVESGGTGVDSDGDWVTPYIMSPTNANLLFVGKSQVYKSTNAGNSWTQMGTLSGAGMITSLAVAASNNNYVYAASNNKLFVTTNQNTWVDRTAGLPVNSASITYITVSNTDPAKAWVTFSGYAANTKIYYTADAGVTWTNYSDGLPNIPANCVIYQNNTSDRLYLGMDIGVYTRDNSMSAWQLFNFGLPNTVVSELDIQYSSGKLRAATYGRGLWESDLYSVPTTAPLAQMGVNYTDICAGMLVQFTDYSTNEPTAWSWDFGGGAASSTQQNPLVTFNTPGTYTVTLTATNGFGANVATQTNLITVYPAIADNTIAADQEICQGQVPAQINGSVPAGGFGTYVYQWERSYSSATSGFVTINSAYNQNYQHTLLNQDIWFRRIALSSVCRDTSSTVHITVHTPVTPVVTVNGLTLTTSGTGTFQWNLNGSPIAGATDTFYVASQDGNYTVTFTDTNGCAANSSSVNLTPSALSEAAWEQTVSIFPNPANGKFNLAFSGVSGKEYAVNIFNALGEIVYAEALPEFAGSYAKEINLGGNAAGCYHVRITDGTSSSYSRVIIW